MNDKVNNPANGIEDLPKDFVPMTSATLRLQVPHKDGWHRHWFRGTPERIQRARQAGYRFVDKTDPSVSVRNFDLGGSEAEDGSTDLGSRVSVISGDDIGSDGQPGRLYLMECPQHYYEAAQKILADRNESVAAAIRGGTTGAGSNGETGSDVGKRYTKGEVPNLFTPNKQRRP